jgi:tetratricopeptide (TPR) repeat protein
MFRPLVGLKQYDEALENVDKGFEIDPKDWSALNNKAAVLQKFLVTISTLELTIFYTICTGLEFYQIPHIQKCPMPSF